jgi:hypothetical protein
MSINMPEDDPSVLELKKAKAAAARRRIEGTNYQQERMLDVLQTGAGNAGPSGMLANAGAALGMGQAMGGMMGQMAGAAASGQAAPPPFGGPPPFGAPVVQFFIHVSGQQMGPYGVDVLAQGVPTGQFTTQTPVWRQGMSGWAPAGTVPELAALFGPPPMPPAGGPPPFGGPPTFGG